MRLFTSTTWPTHHVTNLYIELVNPNMYFLIVLRLSSYGQAPTWKALYINVMFSNDIKLMNVLLDALTVLGNIMLNLIKIIKFNLIKVSRFQRKTSYYSSVFFPLLILSSSVGNGGPYCYSSVFVSLLLRSSVSNGRPFCYSIVSFSLLFLWFFLLILCSEFLGKAFHFDFHELFRTDILP